MSAITEYNRTEAALALLRQRYENVVFDVTTAPGDKAARATRTEIKGYRTTLETIRKDIKAPALERCRLIDEEAKRITVELLKLEQPIDEQIKAEERRKEEEKAARAAAEKVRIDSIRTRIDEIRSLVAKVVGKPSAIIAEQITVLEQRDITADEYQEFAGDALRGKTEVIARLKDLHARTATHEAEQARLAAERKAEAVRLKAEREAIEAEQARLAAVREAQEAALRAQREAEAQNIAAERAELMRQQAEFAEQKRRQEEDEVRRLREAAKRPANAETAACGKTEAAVRYPSRPSDDQIIEALAQHFGVDEITAIDWLREINLEAASERLAVAL